ncbi:DUF2993 domain-containing protein [Spongisporangium articulatum]|uniref:DUF2993 domain-containing protein n=1 Tax=Spongisporangium articulatum TaxID=3362603 RepID=A0ABW8AIH5_9ACTN
MRRLIIVVVVVLVLLLGADRIALVAAERGVAVTLQDAQKLKNRPEVSIGGFPLLTQALRGRYDQVDTTFTDLQGGDGLTIDRLDVHLSGVHLPLSSLLNQSVTQLPVDEASATGTVSYASLNAAAAQRITLPGLTVKFSQGTKGHIKISGTYSGFISAQLDGEAEISVRGRSLVVAPTEDSLAQVPSVIRGRLIALLGDSYELPPLPFGFTPDKVTVAPTGVTLKASASDVVLK